MSITNHEFKSLVHALTYVERCPICLSGMGVDNDTNAYCRLLGEELVNESRDWNISIAIDGSKLTINRSRQVGFMDSDFSGPMNYHDSETPHISHIIGTQVTCANKDCSSYSYVFSFRVKTHRPFIEDIYLNTEYLIFDEAGVNYEITNSHSVQKTRYKVSGADPFRDIKSLELPFIPFDHSNPNKTLEKVKNLIIFT